MVLFKQHIREPIKNEESPKNVVQFVQPEKISIVPLSNTNIDEQSKIATGKDLQHHQQLDAEKTNDQSSNTTITKQTEMEKQKASKQKVLAVICTLCRKKFESYDSYRDHLPECTNALSVIENSKSPAIPQTKISELSRDEWRTVCSQSLLF